MAPKLKAYLLYQIQFYATFILSYFGGYFLGSSLREPSFLAMPFEINIPLVEWMIIPYFSITTIYLLPLVYLDAKEIDTLSKRTTIVIVISGLFFIFLPTASIYPTAEFSGILQPILDLLVSFDPPYNLVPSLHVAMGSLIAISCSQKAGRLASIAIFAWLALMSASTIFTHRHHILDVVTGLALAALVWRYFKA